MDEKDFKKHLADLAHGHHHVEEHDWSPDSPVSKGGAHADHKRARPRAAAKKPKRRAK